MKSEAQYIDLYEQCREMICRHSSDVMNAAREAAFQRFKSLGFPTQKVERYKYTDMAALFAPDYGLNLNRLVIPVNPYDAFRCDVPNLSTLLYFVVNDVFYSKVEGQRSKVEGQILNLKSQISNLKPEGVIIDSINKHPDIVAKYYNRLASQDEDGITALNTMLAQDGLLVYVPRGMVMDRPVQIINILRSDVDLMVNRRVLIVLEEGAEAKLLFCDHAADDKHFLATQVIEAFVGGQASLDLYCLEETHAKNVRVSNVYVDQGWLPPDGADVSYLRWLYTAFTRTTNRLYLVNWPEAQIADN